MCSHLLSFPARGRSLGQLASRTVATPAASEQSQIAQTLTSVHDVKIVRVCCLGIFGMCLRSSEHLLEGAVRVPSRPLDQIVQQRHGADSRESPSVELRQDVSA